MREQSQLRRLPATPEPMHRWTDATGLVIAADEWGPVDGIPVLLLHGGGQTRHAWKEAGMELGKKGFRAVAYDARGHGDSSWSPRGEYGEEFLVGDLVKAIAAIGSASRPILVGASMGGITAMSAIATGALAAEGLVLVDVAPMVEKDGIDRIVQFMADGREGFDSLDEMAAAIAAYQPHRNRPSSTLGLAKNARLGPDGRYFWHWDPAFRPEVDFDELQHRIDSYVERVAVPTLVIRGELSDVLLDRGVDTFLARSPHAEAAEVPDAAHMVAGDSNDAFIDVLVEFLGRIVGDSS